MKWKANKMEAQLWHLGMWFSGGLGSAELMLDLVILEVFSIQKDSIVLGLLVC